MLHEFMKSIEGNFFVWGIHGIKAKKKGPTVHEEINSSFSYDPNGSIINKDKLEYYK